MSVETRPDVNLEELLAHEIPCGGIRDVRLRRFCGRPAVLVRVGHVCPKSPVDGTQYKCLHCWQTLKESIAFDIGISGGVICKHCNGRFASVESFCDYRPF